jgi:hypothetical protein
LCCVHFMPLCGDVAVEMGGNGLRAIVYAVVLSLLSAYPALYLLAPPSLILPGRPVAIDGVVVDKYIGEGGNVTLHSGIWYTVSIRLTGADPVNQVRPGNMFAYVVSKADFERVSPGSHVHARVWALRAQIVAVEG